MLRICCALSSSPHPPPHCLYIHHLFTPLHFSHSVCILFWKLPRIPAYKMNDNRNHLTRSTLFFECFCLNYFVLFVSFRFFYVVFYSLLAFMRSIYLHCTKCSFHWSTNEKKTLNTWITNIKAIAKACNEIWEEKNMFVVVSGRILGGKQREGGWIYVFSPLEWTNLKLDAFCFRNHKSI